MATKREPVKQEERDIPVIPFDEALRRMLAAPPKPAKPAKKSTKDKTGK